MCFSSKPATTTTTSSSTTAPTSEAMSAYRDILSRATNQSMVPYTPYGDPRVAGFSPDQLSAFDATRSAQGVANPYLSAATDYARTGASPITADSIGSYLNPYTQQVIDSTMADMATSNAIAQSQVRGNAALRGALGGSRVGVAQALTAGEQARAQAPVLARLRSEGWGTALGAAQQDRNAAAMGASTFGNLGNLAQNAVYRDIGSLYGMGQQQQANTQAGMDAAYQQWLQQQAYPTQQLSWLSGIAHQAGTGMGTSTTGTGTSTPPAPNPWNAILGAAGTIGGAMIGGPMGAQIGGSLGSAAGSAIGGGGYAHGGVVKGYEDGGIIDFSRDDAGAYSMAGTEGGLPTSGFLRPEGGVNWQSIGNPLMQAGLKMMSSTSPYLGVAIGEGGLAGVKAYGDNQKAEADKKHKEEQLRLQSEKLMQSAAEHRDMMKYRREALDQGRYTWGYDTEGHPVRLPMRGEERPEAFTDIRMAPRGAAARISAERETVDTIMKERAAAGAPVTFEDGLRIARETGRLRQVQEQRERLVLQAMRDGLYTDIREARRAYGLPEGGLAPVALPPPPAPPMGSMGAPMAPMTSVPTPPAPGSLGARDYDAGPGSAVVPPPVRPSTPLPPSPAPAMAPAPTSPPRPAMPAMPVPPRPAGLTNEQLKGFILDKMKREPNMEAVLRRAAKEWGVDL